MRRGGESSRQEEEDWERGKEEKVKESGSEESVRKIEVIESETGSIKEEENDRKMTVRMGSVMTPTLKTNAMEIKQQNTGRFIRANNDKCTGHVRGLILGFEMMGSGDDLKRIKGVKIQRKY